MKILYLHDDTLTKNYGDIISKYGHHVYVTPFNYLNEKNNITIYSGFMADERYSLIVGVGLGAYLSYYISNNSCRPSLLFNPTFFLRSGSELKSNDKRFEIFPEKQFVLGEKNQIIDLKRTLKFLDGEKYVDVKIISQMTHVVKEDVFENCFVEFYNKYKDFINEPPVKKKSTLKSKTSLSVQDPPTNLSIG